jgi:hypothetical protein
MPDLEKLHCSGCGIDWAAPEDWVAEKRESGSGFFCPNGCRRAFKESISDKLRRERDRLKQQLAERDDAVLLAERDRLDAMRRARAYKGQVTKLKNRSAAGICPCCNRSFENLRRHMKSKHPNFAEEPDLKVLEGGKSA